MGDSTLDGLGRAETDLRVDIKVWMEGGGEGGGGGIGGVPPIWEWEELRSSLTSRCKMEGLVG